jgi:hypothetical protein
MEKWKSPPHQLQLKGCVTKKFGYDTRGIVDYQFNSQGFRSPEITNQPTIFFVGNSISFGIGLDESHTFVALTANTLNFPYVNLSYGCYKHENHDHLDNVKNISLRNQDDIIVVQINNLDRRRRGDLVLDGNHPEFCKNKFLDYFEKVNSLLKNKTKIFLYWDNVVYDLPKSVTDQIFVYNRGHLDQSLSNYPDTFGIKTHNFISKVLCQHLQNQLDQK